MAIRTISATGGNYNATTTWVEGVVPTSSDEVVGDATSGNLTINAAAAAREIRLADYLGTLTFNATWTVSGSGVTHSFSPTMSIAGTGRLAMSGTSRFTTFGKVLPNLSNVGTLTLTLVDTMNVETFIVDNANASNFSGGTMSVSSAGTGGVTGNTSNTISNLNLVIAGTASLTNFRSTMTNVKISFEAGTTTFNTAVNGPTLNGSTVSHVAGSIVNGNFKLAGGGTNVFDAQSITWSNISIVAGSGEMNTLRGLSAVKIDKLFITDNNAAPSTNPHGLILSGTAAGVTCSEVYIVPSLVLNSNRADRIAPTLRLQSGFTHSFGGFYCNGLDNPNTNSGGSTNSFCRIDSTTVGSQSGLLITQTQSISKTWIRDIVGQTPIYVLMGTTSNTTNVNVIDQYYYTQASAGGGSWTFVN